MEFQLAAAIEIEPQGIGLGFSNGCATFVLDPMKQDAESCGSHGFGSGQLNGLSGKCAPKEFRRRARYDSEGVSRS